MAKILVIDDDADVLEMMRLLLERHGGHQAVLSADGADGLAKAMADPPDLAIIDVMMPVVTGYEVCRQLRANSSTASVPILILTARGQPVDREAALEAGADDHMAKPVMVTELIERINDLLGKRTAAKPPLLTGTVVMLSLRGGVGVTTLAVNLAATLAQTGDGAVCLVDLCPSSGHAALQLGLRPEPNWSALIQENAPDAGIVEAQLLQHASGLRLLASPFLPLVEQELSRTVVQATFEILQRRFTVIIVDTASALNEATLTALDAATVVGLVITAETSSIQTAIGTTRALRQQSDKFHIILNQVTPFPQPPNEAIERALKQPLAGAIPFDPAQARALAKGTPLALSSLDSPLAKAVQELIQKLT